MRSVAFASVQRLPALFSAHSLAPSALLLFDRNTHRLFFEGVSRALDEANVAHRAFVVPAGESAKSLRVAERLYGEFIKSGADRATTLVAIGGGVVGDLGGFLAASYLRGIPLVHVPTTLLAMVDSAIGGKVALNHPLGKNMIGFFYPPVFTLVDANFLRTLPKRDVYSGLAEALKYALIQDAPFLDDFESRFERLASLEFAVIERVLRRSVRNKLRVVRRDFKETTGLRAILNFGHTFGHALETLSAYKAFRHGEAVLIGMLCASALSKNLGLLDEAAFERVARVIRRFPIPPNVLERHFLAVDERAIEAAMTSDKKKAGGTIRFVLLKRIGEAFLSEGGVPTSEVRRAIKEAKSRLR